MEDRARRGTEEKKVYSAEGDMGARTYKVIQKEFGHDGFS
jgi:hypothetical protein